MANPTGTINADEDHTGRTLVKTDPTINQDAATKHYVDASVISGVNAFGTIVVAGQSNVIADAAPDTLTLVAGSNVTLTTNASTDTVTIAAAASVSDTAFGSSWNTITTSAPSKNALYDQLHLFDTDDDGKINVLDTVAGLVKTDASGVVSNAAEGSDYLGTARIDDTAYDATTWNGDTTHAPSKNAVRDKIEALGGGGTVTTTGSPATGNLSKFSGATSITNGDLSGDVTTSGTLATTIVSNAVTLAKMATMATDSILGRATDFTGNVEVLTALPFAFTGDVTRPADSNATTIAGNAVTYAKMQAVSATSKLLGSSSTTTPVQEITIGSGLSLSGTTLTSTGGGGGTIASTSDILKGDGSGNAVALGSATTGKVLKSNGTVFVASTETYAAPGTTGNVLTSDGTNWTSAAPTGGGGGGTTVKVSGSNFTTTSLTLVDITGLTFAASANVTYEVECTLYGGPADTAGLRIGLNYSGTHTSTEGFLAYGPSTTTGTQILGTQIGSLTTGGFCTGSQTASTFKIWAVIHTTGTGNITTQVCKNTSGTATIIVGSRMTVTVL